jgi:hypothetical protein
MKKSRKQKKMKKNTTKKENKKNNEKKKKQTFLDDRSLLVICLKEHENHPSSDILDKNLKMACIYLSTTKKTDMSNYFSPIPRSYFSVSTILTFFEYSHQLCV